MQAASHSKPRITTKSQLAAQGRLAKRLDGVMAVALFVVSLTLYLRTLAPSLLYGDSAEFQTIAYTLGIGHPTGYPVYILLAKLFTLLPWGEVAYRVNLCSACCAALTVSFVYLIARKLGAELIPALYSALLLTIAPLFWKNACIAEIYAASALCLALILFSVMQWKATNAPRWLFLAGMVGGLSLGVHTTVALLAPALLIYLTISFYFPLSTVHHKKTILLSLYGTLLGSALFLCSFLFLDSLNSPAGYYNTVVRPSLSTWEMVPADFDSPFERLSFLYFPPQFRGQFFAVSSEEVLTRLRDFVEQAPWSLWLALLGVMSLFLPRKAISSGWREAILLLVGFITFLSFAITYNVYDYYVYYIPAIFIATIGAGLGIHAILELVARIPRIPGVIPVGIGILILALGAYRSTDDVSSHWEERLPPALEDWEGYFFSFPENRKFEAEQTLNLLDDNAIVFTDWDNAYSFYYVAHVLQGRTGMSFHETFPQEGVTQFAESALAYIEANIDRRPIYFGERPSFLGADYNITRTGSGLFRIEHK